MRRREERPQETKAPSRKRPVLGDLHAVEDLFLLAGVAMRPEKLTSPQLGGLVAEFRRLKACLQ